LAHSSKPMWPAGPSWLKKKILNWNKTHGYQHPRHR
jgi:hypothetical protein